MADGLYRAFCLCPKKQKKTATTDEFDCEQNKNAQLKSDVKLTKPKLQHLYMKSSTIEPNFEPLRLQNITQRSFKEWNTNLRPDAPHTGKASTPDNSKNAKRGSTRASDGCIPVQASENSSVAMIKTLEFFKIKNASSCRLLVMLDLLKHFVPEFGNSAIDAVGQSFIENFCGTLSWKTEAVKRYVFKRVKKPIVLKRQVVLTSIGNAFRLLPGDNSILVECASKSGMNITVLDASEEASYRVGRMFDCSVHLGGKETPRYQFTLKYSPSRQWIIEPGFQGQETGIGVWLMIDTPGEPIDPETEYVVGGYVFTSKNLIQG